MQRLVDHTFPSAAVAKVAIVAPPTMFRVGLEALLSSRQIVTFVGAGWDDAVVAEPPDVVFLHLDAAGEQLATWGRITTSLPRSGLIVLVPWVLDERLHAVAERGARVFVAEWAADARDVFEAMSAAACGVASAPSAIASVLLQGAGWFRRLSPREREILRYVVRGDSDAEIADALTLSVHGVKKRVKAILSKLGAKNRTQAAVQAVVAGLAPADLAAPVLQGSRSLASK